MSLKSNFDEAFDRLTPESQASFKDRHPSSLHMMRVLAPNPNLPPRLLLLSYESWGFGLNMFFGLPDGPELTAGLRKLVEAKDCFVRAALDTEPVDYRDR